MTETSAKRETGRPGRARRGNPVSRLYGALALFIRQILDEMRKVVRPTGPELVRYTSVVIVFVLVIMAVISGFDFVWSKLISWTFTGKFT